MHVLILLLTSCAPNDAEIVGSYHTWLAKNSSATVYERNLDISDSIVMDCRRGLEDEEREPGYVCRWGDVSNPVNPDWLTPQNTDFMWLVEDVFYLKQAPIEAHRTEALITSEGDFQLTVHHDLGDGELLRYVFVIDPNYNPTVCAPAGATCFNSGELTDDDGDGWADYLDPDCLNGAYEVGFTDVACNDGLDNDGDGLIDAADDGCGHALDTSEGGSNCTDGDDNDGDGWRDAADPDCALYGTESGESNSFYACTDGIDNDGDGDVDGDDAQCEVARDNDESGFTDEDPCSDEFDNDGDGWVDDSDPDCDVYGDEAGLWVTACSDGVDNDGDGLTDADDSGCLVALDANEADYTDDSCTNGDDDDGDGYEDLDDPDCLFGVAEDGGWTSSQCNDGVNNDAPDDEDVDDADRQCQSGFDNAEASTGSGTCRDADLIDEDGDGWVNEEDPDCALGSNEIGYSTYTCNDGIDNDGDGNTDVDDAGCISPLRASEELDISTDCVNGVDDDGDGYVDVDDMGCLLGDFEDDVPTSACSDGADNDGDGLTDADDPDCLNSGDDKELTNQSCADALDNDGDGWVDSVDPDCVNLGYERGFTSDRCADGVDNDGDGLIDGLDDGCTNPSDPFEVEVDECADGIDNDGDSWTDDADLDCILQDEPFEDGSLAGLSACSNGVDDDSDGLIDGLDDDCTSAFDNIEGPDEYGEATSFPLDYYDTLSNWSADEDGYNIYYLNAGTFQLNPSDSENEWVLPQEWLSGYATAKFAAEEFDALPPRNNCNEDPDNDGATDCDDDYFWNYDYLGFDVNNPPSAEEYDAAVQVYRDAAEAMSAEPATYGLASFDAAVGDYELKVEGNEWRPLDAAQAGLDNWVEIHSSWVRIEEGAVFAKGSSFSGDYQILMSGRDAASKMILKGSFTVNNLREDIWGYDVLEDELEAELEADGYAISTCD